MEIVLDRSFSMTELNGTKLQAAKIAGQALVEALNLNDDLGIVSFNQDARNTFPLSTLSTPAKRQEAIDRLNELVGFGCTAMGDGILEAQSYLADAYDELLPANRPRQAMVVLSDGLSNVPYEPWQYYTPQPGPQTFITDGTVNQVDPCEAFPGDLEPPWFLTKLRYPERVSAMPQLPVPIVSGVAIGSDADIGQLQSLVTTATGGVLTHVEGPAIDNLPQRMLTTIRMSDAFRQSANVATGHERVAALQAISVLPPFMPPLEVEPGVSELLVTVTSARDPTQGLRLVSPLGQVVLPVEGRIPATVFRVPAPASGVWTWRFDEDVGRDEEGLPPRPPSTDDPAVFIENAVRSPLQLFASADVGVTLPPAPGGGPYESGRFVGSDVFVRAALTDGQPILGALVVAKVTAPDGSTSTLVLLDDGTNNDGVKNDGVYGAVYTQTLLAGPYPVRIQAFGTSNVTGALFQREKAIAFELHSDGDFDGDGLPDGWERAEGTNPTVPDGDDDVDGDGLPNRDEFPAGTSPLRADTDGGGESDGSEVPAGRDPLDPSDDVVGIYEPVIAPGNGKVLMRPQVPVSTNIEVQRAGAPDGFFETVFAGVAPETEILTDPAPNDVTACYRMRVERSGATSGWSAPVCATPRVDPFAPNVNVSTVPGSIKKHKATLRITAAEIPALMESTPDLIDPDVRPSGLASMRISTDANFSEASWVPYQPEQKVHLSETEELTAFYVQVRDHAGNESMPAIILVRAEEDDED